MAFTSSATAVRANSNWSCRGRRRGRRERSERISHRFDSDNKDVAEVPFGKVMDPKPVSAAGLITAQQRKSALPPAEVLVCWFFVSSDTLLREILVCTLRVHLNG